MPDMSPGVTLFVRSPEHLMNWDGRHGGSSNPGCLPQIDAGYAYALLRLAAEDLTVRHVQVIKRAGAVAREA